MPTKSLLINYVGYPNEIFNLMPDNGLANLAGCLLEKGHSTKILDFSTVDTIRRLYPHKYRDELQYLTKIIVDRFNKGYNPEKKDIDAFRALETKIDDYQKDEVIKISEEIIFLAKKENIDFIGFKLWSGAGFEGSVFMAENIKSKLPGIKIFGGGPHVDWFNEIIFDVTGIFDVLAYGEGEETITLLADYVEGNIAIDNIPNLIFRRNGKIIKTFQKRIDNLNMLPLPVYSNEVYPAMKDNQKVKAILIDESRGCPNSCSFCIHSSKSGKRWRMSDAEILVDKIEQIMKKYKIRVFRFAGSNPPPNLMKKIAEEIIKRNLHITYSAFSYSKGMTREHYQVLKKSGCCAMFFGVESGSSKILKDSMNKQTDINEIKTSLKLCKESGISTIVSLIVPAPFETDNTKQETLNLILETRPDSTIVFFPALIPGIDWEKNCSKYGFYLENPVEFYKQAMTYKAVHLGPPVLWKPLTGFTMNGKDFREISSETANFIETIKRNGLKTQIFDHPFLISASSGFDIGQVISDSKKYFSEGDYDNLGILINKINSNITLN